MKSRSEPFLSPSSELLCIKHNLSKDFWSIIALPSATGKLVFYSDRKVYETLSLNRSLSDHIYFITHTSTDARWCAYFNYNSLQLCALSGEPLSGSVWHHLLIIPHQVSLLFMDLNHLIEQTLNKTICDDYTAFYILPCLNGGKSVRVSNSIILHRKSQCRTIILIVSITGYGRNNASMSMFLPARSIQRYLIEQRPYEPNYFRPHACLKGLVPIEFKNMRKKWTPLTYKRR